jgi:hypothetical protein
MRRAWLALALVPWLALAGPAPAQEPTPSAVDQVWLPRLTDAKNQRDEALRRVIASEAALSSARHRKYPRGEALDAIEKDLESSRKALADAEQRLPELLEQARLAGASPALLQSFEEDEPAASD